MSVDNRTDINDCENVTGFTSVKSPALDTTVGSFFEGAGAISVQMTNANQDLSTTQSSGGGGTFSHDVSDATCYLLLKDNLVQSAANGGVQYALGDGTDQVGFDIAGNDAPGMSLAFYYRAFKLDASNLPSGSNITYSGVEGDLTLTAITEVGYGTIHLAKAVGNVDNAFLDAMSFIANGSYALTINGGTAGTPETMVDVQGDDAGGLLTGIGHGGMIGNPLGSQYTFFAPTEWGNVSTIAEHAFTADGEQWFWIGDNLGGHTVGATHFPFRLVSNVTDTGSWIVSNVSIVNTGTRAQFLMDNADFNTIEMDGCSLTGLGTISLPSSGGTSRFTTNCIFTDCGEITNNGANMSGSSILLSNAAADAGALIYAESADPDGELNDMTFSQGAAAHHAIDFQTGISATQTLRNCDFNGFSSSDDVSGSVFKFPDGAGPFTLNLVNCTNDGSGFTVDSTSTVNVVIDPVTTLIHVDDNTGADLQNCRVYLKASAGPLPFEDSVTISRSGTVATVTHASHGMETNDKVKIQGITDKVEDNNGVHQITFISAGSYSYVTTDSGSTSYTGTIIATWVALEGDTDVGGDISLSKTYSSAQPVTGFARKSTASPRFKSRDLNGTISNTLGLTINVRMILDE